MAYNLPDIYNEVGRKILVANTHIYCPELFDFLPQQRQTERVTPFFVRFCAFCEKYDRFFTRNFREPERTKAILFIYSLNSSWLTTVCLLHISSETNLRTVRALLCEIYPYLRIYWSRKRIEIQRKSESKPPFQNRQIRYPWRYSHNKALLHRSLWPLGRFMRVRNKFLYPIYNVIFPEQF